MIEIIRAGFALALLLAFCLILIWYVGHVDLAIVVIAVLFMAIYDFYRELRAQRDQK